MPTPECRGATDGDIVLELFLGEFPGRSHMSRFIQHAQFPIQTCLSLDVDRVCLETYHSLFGGFLKFHGIPFESDPIDVLPCLLVVESDVLKFDCIHLTGQDDVDIGVCSPPCLPWSKAFLNASGLRRKDGTLTPVSIALLALMGCQVICLENVAGLLQHPHWKLVLE